MTPETTDTTLFQMVYPPEHPRGIPSHDLFVWVPVHTETGEVEMDGLKVYGDELGDLVKGWEWQKFRLNIHDHRN